MLFHNCFNRVTYLLLAIVINALVGGCGEKTPSPSAIQEKVKVSQEQEVATEAIKAESGDINAQYNLGKMYSSGEGVPKDNTKAVEWYQKAAAQGFSPAQNALGEAFYYGSGVPESMDSAFEWFQKAAAQNNSSAEVALGRMYIRGEGVTKDARKGVEWFQKAAAQGDARGESSLGWVYSQGIGVEKSITQALYWFQKAAEQEIRMQCGELDGFTGKDSGFQRIPSRQCNGF